jgi:hypothetical protein
MTPQSPEWEELKQSTINRALLSRDASAINELNWVLNRMESIEKHSFLGKMTETITDLIDFMKNGHPDAVAEIRASDSFKRLRKWVKENLS